jgi:amidohydrolase
MLQNPGKPVVLTGLQIPPKTAGDIKTMNKTIADLTAQYENVLVENRRHLHSHPEPSYREEKTRQFIIEKLEAWGIPYEKSDKYYYVVGRIKGDRPGKTVAFRADIDALELPDKKDVPYRSRNENCAHACGHDAHTSVLLALAHLFSTRRELVSGEVVFIFQHAEETLPGGAYTIINDGFLERVDVIFGAHVWLAYELGKIGVREGPIMASSDEFRVDIAGRGGHGSEPHRNVDVLLAAAALTTQLQNIVSRMVPALEPAALSVCELHGGSAFNVMPDTAYLRGTVRAFNEKIQDVIEEKIRRMAESICAAFGAEQRVSYLRGFPPTVNDAAVTVLFREAVQRDTDYELITSAPVMGGEDFSYYLRKTPGVFFFVGARNENRGIIHPHHHPLFDIDERAMSVALSCFLAAYFHFTSHPH